MKLSDEQTLRVQLQFLALDQIEKIGWLSESGFGGEYLLDDAGLKTHSPALCMAFVTFRRLERQSAERGDPFGEIIRHIRVILELVLDQQAEYAYMWELDKRACPVSGPADHLWEILRRFASEALALRGWPACHPEISFQEMTMSRRLPQ